MAPKFIRTGWTFALITAATLAVGCSDTGKPAGGGKTPTWQLMLNVDVPTSNGRSR